MTDRFSTDARWRAERVLAFAPHPDDDVLACGGTLARAASAGAFLRVVYVTDGSASHVGSRAFPAARLATLREAEAREALQIIGVPAESAHFMRERDTHLPSDGPAGDALTERLAAHVRAFAPSIVFSPWIRDAHGDHVATSQAVRRALVREASPAVLFEYAVWLAELGTPADAPAPGEVEDVTLDITAHRERKARAIAAHRSQLGLVIDDADEAFALPPALLRRAAANVERFYRISLPQPATA